MRAARRILAWRPLPPVLCLAAALLLFGWDHAVNPRRPSAPVLTQGWWTFSDQGRYLLDALAWARGSLDPASHYYLPGYALLAVPFVHLTPADPFLLPNALSLLAALWLAAGVAAELLPGWRLARLTGALAFVGTFALPAAANVWVTPWTTTPTAPLTFACLWALLRYLRDPASWRLALLASLCAATVGAFRPSDSAMLLLLTAVTGAATLVLRRPGWWPAARVVLAAGIAAALPLAATLAIYLAEHGWQASPYIALSGYIGFEWRLLPLQWVTLVLSPQPMLPDGEGLMAAFPFIATGLAGMAACLVAPPGNGRRAGHAVVVVAALAHGALYLCYRDLHPQGLFRYYNYHYFKWLLPVFAFYTLVLPILLLQWRPALAALAVLAAVLPWRAELEVLPDPVPAAQAGRTLALPGGLGIRTALVAGAAGSFDAIYNGVHHFYFGPGGGSWYGSTGGVTAYPLPGGLLLEPLRPISPGPGHADLDPLVSLDPAVPPHLVHLALRYGRPCFLPDWVPGDGLCHSAGPLPPVPWPANKPIVLDGSSERLLLPSWTTGTGGNLWTEGRRAGLRARLEPPPTAGATVTIEARAFLPNRNSSLGVRLLAGTVPVTSWTVADGAHQSLHATLPPSAFGADGAVELTFLIDNPRRPSDGARTPDNRFLGLLVDSVRFDTAPNPPPAKESSP